MDRVEGDGGELEESDQHGDQTMGASHNDSVLQQVRCG